MTGGVNYLLGIAIDAYQHMPLLYNCKKDAETFIELMLENYQFEKANVVRVFDQDATLKGMHAAFRGLVEKVTPKDNLVIYFSGHGEYDPLLNEGYWIPVEAHQGSLDEYFSNDMVRRYISSIKSHHTFLISDSCFAGALFEEGTGKSGGLRSERDPSRWGLTAGRKEIVSDGKPGMHSPFADALLYRLRNNQGSLSVQKLCSDVLEQVEANAFQAPIGEPLRVQGHKNGQFYFHPKRNEARAWQAALAANSVQAFLDFEAEYPESESVRSGEVDKHIAALEDEVLWQDARRSNTVTAYREYLRRTRLGKYRTEADEAIAGFRRKEEGVKHTKEAARKVPQESERPWKEEEKPPVKALDWSRLKLPLSIAVIAIVTALVVWQVGKSSKPTAAAVWDCTQYYDQCLDKGDYYLVQRGQLWGYADKKGEVLMEPRFSEVDSFDANGLALVKESGQYKWIDRQGNTKLSFGQAKPLEMVFVNGGKFTMGCTEEQGSECESDENPKHQVTVKDFKIGKYEVTQAEWRAVMGEDPTKLYNKGCDQCPVESISWDDIQEFLKKLNEQTGKGYRLPTEAEWEYAARGGSESKGYKFAGSNNPEEVAWYMDNAKAGNENGSQGTTRPVGSKKPNELGVYDMSGNVWEAVEDCWHANYENAPSGGLAWLKGNGGDCVQRVLRGGSWINSSRGCRVSERHNGLPGEKLSLSGGFRLAQD